MLCPVLLKGVRRTTTTLTTSAPLQISSDFCKFPAVCKRQLTKEPGNTSEFQAVDM